MPVICVRPQPEVDCRIPADCTDFSADPARCDDVSVEVWRQQCNTDPDYDPRCPVTDCSNAYPNDPRCDGVDCSDAQYSDDRTCGGVEYAGRDARCEHGRARQMGLKFRVNG